LKEYIDWKRAARSARKACSLISYKLDGINAHGQPLIPR
jgi:hypothetical protein